MSPSDWVADIKRSSLATPDYHVVLPTLPQLPRAVKRRMCSGAFVTPYIRALITPFGSDGVVSFAPPMF